MGITVDRIPNTNSPFLWMLGEATAPIQIWRFGESPYDDLAASPDDRDWVMLVPDAYSDEFLPEWIATEGGPFGCCGVECVSTLRGFVYIGRHA